MNIFHFYWTVDPTYIESKDGATILDCKCFGPFYNKPRYRIINGAEKSTFELKLQRACLAASARLDVIILAMFYIIYRAIGPDEFSWYLVPIALFATTLFPCRMGELSKTITANLEPADLVKYGPDIELWEQKEREAKENDHNKTLKALAISAVLTLFLTLAFIYVPILLALFLITVIPVGMGVMIIYCERSNRKKTD